MDFSSEKTNNNVIDSWYLMESAPCAGALYSHLIYPHGNFRIFPALLYRKGRVGSDGLHNLLKDTNDLESRALWLESTSMNTALKE